MGMHRTETGGLEIEWLKAWLAIRMHGLRDDGTYLRQHASRGTPVGVFVPSKQTTTFRFEEAGWQTTVRTGSDEAPQIDVILRQDVG